MKRILVTVTGPSASGKTELVARLSDAYNCSKLVSVTTRPPRPGEVEGTDYYFISEDKFKEYVDNDGLVQSVNFNGKNYGTTVDELERVFAEGRTPVVIVEPGGVDQFRNLEEKLNFKVYCVFIAAPYKVLEERFKARLNGEEMSDYDLKRLAAVKVESETWEGTQDWDSWFQNGGTDKAAIDWFCNNLNISMEEFKQGINNG